MLLEILYFTFMFLRRIQGIKCSEVLAFVGPWIF